MTMTTSKNNLSYTQIYFIGVVWKSVYLLQLKFPFNVIFRAPDEILGVPGPEEFWMPWRMIQKRIPWQSTISQKVGGIFPLPPPPLSGGLRGSFSPLKKLKTKMRSITHNKWLNNLILLYVYQKKIIEMDIHKIATSLLPGKTRGKNDLLFYKFHNTRTDTMYDSG